jgi:hypothetical protein
MLAVTSDALALAYGGSDLSMHWQLVQWMKWLLLVMVL